MTRFTRPASGWQRHVKAAFTENLLLKALAVLLAIVMWVLVAAREPMEQIVGVQFRPQLDSNLVLRDAPPMIRAVVLGSASEVLKLANTPLVISRPVAGDAPDTLVMPLRTGDVTVPDGVEVIVRDVQPHSLTLRFESTASRMVPVRPAVIVRTPDLSPVPLRLSPESVTVLGPRRLVARVRYVSTVADSITVDTLPRLVDLDTARLGVTVRPAQVRISFPRLRP